MGGVRSALARPCSSARQRPGLRPVPCFPKKAVVTVYSAALLPRTRRMRPAPRRAFCFVRNELSSEVTPRRLLWTTSSVCNAERLSTASRTGTGASRLVLCALGGPPTGEHAPARRGRLIPAQVTGRRRRGRRMPALLRPHRGLRRTVLRCLQAAQISRLLSAHGQRVRRARDGGGRACRGEVQAAGS
jgi:hypothetical protein